MTEAWNSGKLVDELAQREPAEVVRATLRWVRTFVPTWRLFLENPAYSVRLKDDRREKLLVAIDGRFWELLDDWAGGAVLPSARRTELSGVIGPLYSSAMYAMPGGAWVMVMLNAKNLLQSTVNRSGQPMEDAAVWATRTIANLAAIRCAVPFESGAAFQRAVRSGVTQDQLWSGRFESFGWHLLGHDQVVAEAAFIGENLFEAPTPMVLSDDFWTTPRAAASRPS